LKDIALSIKNVSENAVEVAKIGDELDALISWFNT
jgi:hypothetical protein